MRWISIANYDGILIAVMWFPVMRGAWRIQKKASSITDFGLLIIKRYVSNYCISFLGEASAKFG